MTRDEERGSRGIEGEGSGEARGGVSRPSPADAGPSGRFTPVEMRAGLFVLLASLVFAFFYFFGKDVVSMLRPHHRLVACFDDVAGLEEGARVRFAGMEIGRVTDIRFVEAETHKVEADLRVLATVPIREGAVASIRSTELVIGKYVDISGGRPDGKLLEDGAVVPGGREPVIDEVINAAGGIILDIRDIVKQMNEILLEQDVPGLLGNLGRLVEIAADPESNLLINLRSLVETMAEAGTAEDLIAITHTIASNKDRLLDFVEEGNRLAADTRKLLLDHQAQIGSLVADLARIAEAFSAEAGPLAGNLARLSSEASAGLPGMIERLDALTARMDRTLASLNKILAKTEDLDENDIRRFIQHEGMRIYFLESQAPPLAPEGPETGGAR